MSCLNVDVTAQEKARSGLSRFVFLPIVRGGTKSVVSNHIVKILRKSNFCTSSPLLKSLIIHNIQMCCIVIETSGTQSVKVICASVPYLVKLLSKANPKLKRMLEDENVATYLKFFQETDLESLLASLCTATFIIQKGVELCYPTLCVTLSRDVILLGKETLKWLVCAVYNCLVHACNVLSEELGPVFLSLCAKNRYAVKYFAKNLPVAAFAAAKGLVLFSLLMRRVLRAFLRIVKRFVIILKCELLKKSIDINVLDICQRVFLVFKYCAEACDLHEYVKYVYEFLKHWCIPASKDFVLIFIKISQKFTKRFIPIFKKCFHFAMLCGSPLFNEKNLQEIFDLICNAKLIFNCLWINFKPYYQQLWNLILHLGVDILAAGRTALPHVQKWASVLFRMLIDFIATVIRYRFTLYNTVCDFSSQMRNGYPILRHLVLSAIYKFKMVAEFTAMLFGHVIYYSLLCSFKIQNKLLEYHDKIIPYLYPVVCELNSTFISVSRELSSKTVSSANRIFPSFWCALKTLTPFTIMAANELLVAFKISFIVTYPSLLEAIVAVRPEVAKSLAVAIGDGNKAFVEMVNVSFTASYHMGIAAKNVSCQFPIIFNAIDIVTTTSLCATSEVYTVSLKAHARVFKDLKKASGVVETSIKAAEVELAATLREARKEVKCIIKDNPEVLHFFTAVTKEGGMLPRLIALSNSLCRESFFIAAVVSATGLRKSSIIFLKYAPMPTVRILNYIFKTDRQKTFSIIYEVLNKMVHFPVCQTVCYNLFYIIHSVAYSGIRRMDNGLSAACSDIAENIVPCVWEYLKEAISVLWKAYCDTTSEFWTCIELWCVKLWSLILNYAPRIWNIFKSACLEVWVLTCKVSPSLWEYTVSSVPVLWCSNRQAIRCAWHVYIQTCSSTWNVVVPLSSATWSYTVDASPRVWLTLSENSKLSWELFCSSTESGWDVVTDLSALSWEVFHKIVSSSWNCGIRSATLSVCCRTSSIVAKSIKFSHMASVRTCKMVMFLNGELTGNRFPLTNIILVTSRLGEGAVATCDSLVKCIIFSNAKFLKNGSGKKVVDAMREIGAIPSRIAGSYLNNFKFENILNNLMAVSKVPLAPVSLTYRMGQKFLRKYSSLSVPSESPLIPVYGLPVFL